MERSKFNVTKDTEKRTHNGIVFDSIMEMKYYRDVVLPKKESGEITNYELQKKYILQDSFEKDGKTIRPITYIADFYIEYSNGKKEVIDVKGMPDNVAKIKRKLFFFRYPNVKYIWVSYIKKFGGWKEYEEIKHLRNQEKLSKKQLAEAKEDN